MTHKYFYYLIVFFVAFFSTKSVDILAQTKFTITTDPTSDCTKKIVNFSYKNAIQWDILDKKFDKTKKRFVDTLVVVKSVNLKYTFIHKGYFVVKAHYTGTFGEEVETTADTSIVFAPYADFQITQEDVGTDKVAVTATALYVDSKSAVTYEWELKQDKKSLKKSTGVIFTSSSLSEERYFLTLKTTLGTCKDSSAQQFVVTRSQFIDSIGNITMFPNVFTPNGDSNNDVFTIPTPIKSYKEGDAKNEYTFEVFNKGGMLIYKSVSPSIYWDGRAMNGDWAKPGTYFYTVKLGSEYLPIGDKGKKVHLLTIFK